MKLVIPLSVSTKFVENLRTANDREIGGVLYAEQKSAGVFHLREATFQMNSGDSGSFRRDFVTAQKDIRRFHKLYNGTAENFNYFGEWHSHPHSSVAPSEVDIRTMRQILDHSDESVNFLVLVIVKLFGSSFLEVNAHAFLRSGHMLECTTDFATSEQGENYD